MGDDKTIREVQATLPWGAHDYGADYRARLDPQRDAHHALLHVTKAAGKLAAVLDRLDHADGVAAAAERHRADAERAIADLLICTLRTAEVYPGRRIEAADALRARVAEVFADAPTRGGALEGK